MNGSLLSYIRTWNGNDSLQRKIQYKGWAQRIQYSMPKDEMARLQYWHDNPPGDIFDSKEQARSEIFQFIEIFYNRKRLHQSLNYQTLDGVELKTVP